MISPPDSINEEQAIAKTKAWLEKIVIGLNLCPFAASAHLNNRIRYVVSQQQTTAGLLDELTEELTTLQQTDTSRYETTLIIHPQVLNDFHLYNDFLDDCDAAIVALNLEGELQIASFHPDYQFAGSKPQDIENFSNRSPYPMLHLLREASVTRALENYPDVDHIIDNNMVTLRNLGLTGWQQLNSQG
ncbi:MAG: DUF1415 domain-containing protein [Steroidobacteraceae bacterium]